MYQIYPILTKSNSSSKEPKCIIDLGIFLKSVLDTNNTLVFLNMFCVCIETEMTFENLCHNDFKWLLLVKKTGTLKL